MKIYISKRPNLPPNYPLEITTLVISIPIDTIQRDCPDFGAKGVAKSEPVKQASMYRSVLEKSEPDSLLAVQSIVLDLGNFDVPRLLC